MGKADSMLELLRGQEEPSSSSESEYEDMNEDPLMPNEREISSASLSEFEDLPQSPKKTRKTKAVAKEPKSLEEQLKEKLKDVESIELMRPDEVSRPIPSATIKKQDSDGAREILNANPALVTLKNDGSQKIYVASSKPAGVRTLQDGLSWMHSLLPSLNDLQLLRFMQNKSAEGVPEEIVDLFKKSQWRCTAEATKKLRLRLSKKKRKQPQPAPPKPTMPTIREEPEQPSSPKKRRRVMAPEPKPIREESEQPEQPCSPKRRRRVMAPSPEPIPSPPPPKRPDPLPSLPASTGPSITVGTPSEDLGQNFTGLFTDCHFELKISGTADQVREQGKRFFSLL